MTQDQYWMLKTYYGYVGTLFRSFSMLWLSKSVSSKESTGINIGTSFLEDEPVALQDLIFRKKLCVDHWYGGHSFSVCIVHTRPVEG